MSFQFRDARRADVPLLILLAGGTASGKTESAMRLATGLAGGKPFAVIDTENGRALHKADDYDFKHAQLDEPFTPERYAEAVEAADAEGFPVIVIDSGSHEYEGVGGVLDMQSAEFQRMGQRDSARMSSWIEPKRRHKLFVQKLLRARAHVILCLRAEDKIEVVKDEQGKTVVRPRQSLTGAQGWIPICEKRLPFEATISLLLLQDQPGVPVPIKLERRHRELVPLDQPLSEKTGASLARWAHGGAPEPVTTPVAEGPGEAESGPTQQSADAGLSEHEPAPSASRAPEVDQLVEKLTGLLLKLERAEFLPHVAQAALNRTEAQYAAWLRKEIERAERALHPEPEPATSQLALPPDVRERMEQR